MICEIFAYSTPASTYPPKNLFPLVLGGVETLLQTERACAFLFWDFISKAYKRWRPEDLKVHIIWQNYFLLASHIIFFTVKMKCFKLWVERGRVWREQDFQDSRMGMELQDFYGWWENIVFRIFWEYESQRYLYSSFVWVLGGKPG